MSKNLTGKKRAVKDACVVLYNAAQKWISITSESHPTLLSICRTRQKQLSYEELTNEKGAEDNEGRDDEDDLTLSFEMQRLSSQLRMQLENLEKVVHKMKKVSMSLKALINLSELESSKIHSTSVTNFDCGSDLDTEILFQQWPLERFYAASNEIKKMHSEELKWRCSFAKCIPLAETEIELSLMETRWRYEIYIDRVKVNELLEAILYELELV